MALTWESLAHGGHPMPERGGIKENRPDTLSASDNDGKTVKGKPTLLPAQSHQLLGILRVCNEQCPLLHVPPTAQLLPNHNR